MTWIDQAEGELNVRGAMLFLMSAHTIVPSAFRSASYVCRRREAGGPEAGEAKQLRAPPVEQAGGAGDTPCAPAGALAPLRASPGGELAEGAAAGRAVDM